MALLGLIIPYVALFSSYKGNASINIIAIKNLVRKD